MSFVTFCRTAAPVHTVLDLSIKILYYQARLLEFPYRHGRPRHGQWKTIPNFCKSGAVTVYQLTYTDRSQACLADSERLTALSCDERNGGTWRTFVLGIEYADLCANVGERPETVDVTGVDVSPVTIRRRRPARTWLAVDNAVFSHRLHSFSRLPELNLDNRQAARQLYISAVGAVHSVTAFALHQPSTLE